MDTTINFDDILTYNGLMLLRRLGNGDPSYSQIEFSQAVISIIEGHSEGLIKFHQLLAQETQSRESLRKDSLFYREKEKKRE